MSKCRELGTLGATSDIYALPAGTSWIGLDNDGDGLLLSLSVAPSLRVVAIQPDGITSVLLGETEYTRQWRLDLAGVIASRTAGVLDVLVSDQSTVDFIRKDSNNVNWFKLARTNNMDLEAQALGTAGARRIAGYARGTDTVTFALVDIDAVTANANKGADLSDTVSQWVKDAGSSRDFVSSVNFNSVPSPIGLWVTAERLDSATECTATGSTVACGAGATIETYDCKWHVDAWHLDSTISLASPTTTVDARMRITPACSDVNMRGLNQAENAFTRAGFSRNHAIAIDPATSRLAIAMDEYLGDRKWDIRVLLLDPSGNTVLDATIPSDAPQYWKSWWLYTRNNRVWICHGTKCAVVDATGTTEFATVAPLFQVKAVMAQPDGFMLVGETPKAVVGAVLPCQNH